MKFRNVFLIISVAFGLFSGYSYVIGADTKKEFKNFKADQVAEIEEIAANLIAKKPELIEAALRKSMEEKEKMQLTVQKEAIAKFSDSLFRDARDAVEGPANGKLTLVAFIDPYCGHCKHMEGEIKKLLAERKDFKVVYKPVAMLGKESEKTACEMIAANKQGKFKPYQESLAKSAAANQEERMVLAKDCGLNTKQLLTDAKNADVQKQLKDTMFLASKLQLNGVPAMIISKDGKTGEFIGGGVPKDALNKMLDAVANTTSA